MTEQQDDSIQTTDADVEGHRVRVNDEDDVEGHVRRPGSAVQPDHDEDDVAGHLVRKGVPDEDDVEGHSIRPGKP